MTSKPKWANKIGDPIRVLNHAEGRRLEKFTDADLDQMADCGDLFELVLRSNRTAQPVEKSPLAHITGLRNLTLERMTFTNLQAFRALPNLRSLSIDDCNFQDFEGLNGLKGLTPILRHNKLKGFPAGLDLSQLESLLLSHNRIADLQFAMSYPALTDLSVDGNLVNDLAPLGACPWLEKVAVDGNHITTLAPLAGLPFKRLVTNNGLHAGKWRCNGSYPNHLMCRMPTAPRRGALRGGCQGLAAGLCHRFAIGFG